MPELWLALNFPHQINELYLIYFKVEPLGEVDEDLACPNHTTLD